MTDQDPIAAANRIIDAAEGRDPRNPPHELCVAVARAVKDMHNEIEEGKKAWLARSLDFNRLNAACDNADKRAASLHARAKRAEAALHEIANENRAYDEGPFVCIRIAADALATFKSNEAG